MVGIYILFFFYVFFNIKIYVVMVFIVCCWEYFEFGNFDFYLEVC